MTYLTGFRKYVLKRLVEMADECDGCMDNFRDALEEIERLKQQKKDLLEAKRKELVELFVVIINTSWHSKREAEEYAYDKMNKILSQSQSQEGK